MGMVLTVPSYGGGVETVGAAGAASVRAWARLWVCTSVSGSKERNVLCVVRW